MKFKHILNRKNILQPSTRALLISSIRDDEKKENTEREHGVGDERYSKIKTKNGDIGSHTCEPVTGNQEKDFRPLH